MLDNKNLVLAVFLSVAILFAFHLLTQWLHPPSAPVPPSSQTQTGRPTTPAAPPGTVPGGDIAPPGVGTAAPAPGAAPAAGAPSAGGLSRTQVLAQSPRVRIDTPSLHGSIALIGGRIDDVT